MPSKEPFVEKLRTDILGQIPEALETDRASIGRIELSFTSKVYPHRHIWISVQWPGNADSNILIDLEDWSLGESPDDRTVLSIDLTPIKPITELVRDWLCGVSAAEISAKFSGAKMAGAADMDPCSS